MPCEPPTLAGLQKVLEEIAGDSRIPPNFAEWIRDTLRYGGRKIRILRYILAHTPENQTPRLLDVGAQFGALAIYATQLGCRAAALDYGMYAKAFREAVADRGVDYRECDLGREPLPFADNSFDFATYTDVIEHHAFSPKRARRNSSRSRSRRPADSGNAEPRIHLQPDQAFLRRQRER